MHQSNLIILKVSKSLETLLGIQEFTNMKFEVEKINKNLH